MNRPFDVIIDRDTEGNCVAWFRSWRAATRRRSLWITRSNASREAIALCVDVESTAAQDLEVIGIQRITIAA